MKKKAVFICSLLACLLGSSCAIAGIQGHAVQAYAEEEVISSEPISEEPVEEGLPYSINEAYIGYRDSEDSSYGAGTSAIGLYYLSAYGWAEDESEPIIMTVKGSVTTKLEGKIVYVYEYKPTLVKFAGAEVILGEDKAYSLAKPAEKGAYDLEIYFTKSLITNPMDLTSINWASLFTVQNLMTIVSWAVIFVGIIAMYVINAKYKKRGSTTLEEVKGALSKQIETQFGEKVASQVNELLDKVVKQSFDVLTSKMDAVDSNVSVLMRCLLVMQENTPEARLAVTEYLSQLQSTNDGQAAQVKALIEGEMAKFRAEQEAQAQAIAEAEQANKAWQEAAELETPEEPSDDDGYGTL